MNSLAWVAATSLVGCMYHESSPKALTSSLKKGTKSPPKTVKASCFKETEGELVMEDDDEMDDLLN